MGYFLKSAVAFLDLNEEGLNINAFSLAFSSSDTCGISADLGAEVGCATLPDFAAFSSCDNLAD